MFALAGVDAATPLPLIFGGLGALLLAWAAVVSAPFGDLASSDGFSPTMRALVARHRARPGRASPFVWWRRAGGARVLGGHVRARDAGPLARSTRSPTSCASQLFEGAWWASLALRAGQFAIPAVGLLIGFIAVAEKLREFEDELTANLVAERERARAHEERVTLDAERRERVQARMQRMIDGANALVVDAASFAIGGLVLALSTRGLAPATPAASEADVAEVATTYAGELRDGSWLIKTTRS